MRGPVEDDGRDEIDGVDVRCVSAVRNIQGEGAQHTGGGSSNDVRIISTFGVVHVPYIIDKRDRESIESG